MIIKESSVPSIIEPGIYNEVFGCKFKEPKIITSPIYTWCEKLDQQAAEQAVNMSNVVYVHDHVALMAGTHGGYGIPIGGVLPVKDIILPYAVGNDIGCFTGDTKIALLNGETKTFKEQLNKKFWIYSISDDNMIIPGYAECIKTRENTQLVEVEINNGEKIRCTPDQLFKMRNCEYKEAQHLESGDSLMPLYVSYQKRDGYEILHNPDNHYTLTHRIVSESIFGSTPDDFVIHHINKNKIDNRPENIILMNKNEHNSLHSKDQIERLQSKEFKEYRINKLKRNGFYDQKYYQKKKDTATKNIKKYMKDNPEKFKDGTKNNGQRGRKYLINYNKSERGRSKSSEISNRLYKCNICGKEIKSPIGLYNHKRKEHNNHKVINVKFLNEREDVYCLTVNNRFHNFALASGVFVHNCGMRAVKLEFKSHDLTFKLIERIMKEVSRVVPHGTGVGHKQKQSWVGFNYHPKFPVYIQAAFETAEYQLGSLGAGNHFLEILKDDQGYVWLMIHSGSRNLGANVCTEFYHRAVDFCEKYKCEVPSKHLSYLPFDHEDGQWYYDMMNFAMDFAEENRNRMMNVFMTIACGMLKCDSYPVIYDVHHNFAQLEQYGDDPSWIIVHRKGATPAPKGLISIIPGSMGTPSYIVMGKGNPESFNSVSHGAGRTMSRKEAKKKFKENETKEILRGIWVNHIALDEDPRCYKDINQIIVLQNNLVEPIRKLEPLGVIIGT